jgi:hypothetical protein
MRFTSVRALRREPDTLLVAHCTGDAGGSVIIRTTPITLIIIITIITTAADRPGGAVGCVDAPDEGAGGAVHPAGQGPRLR